MVASRARAGAGTLCRKKDEDEEGGEDSDDEVEV